MLFTTFYFFLFFFIFFIFYQFKSTNKSNQIVLLIANIIFFTWTSIITILPIIIVVILTFTVAQLQIKNKVIFYVGIITNIGILIYYKYVHFFLNILIPTSLLKNVNLEVFNGIEIPLGLSYITFQSIGYLIDVKSEKQKPEKNILILFNYLLFFPKLLAGPIERSYNFLPQLHSEYKFNYVQFTSGLRLIAWGLYKKVIIADRLSPFVQNVFNNANDHNGFTLIITSFLYTIQMYTDFSGYSDMAVGIAKLFGFELTLNFNSPFSAKSITEFWRKWHISLSTWFADYFYTPLALKNREWGNWGIIYAFTVTFLVLGLWHGANFTFIVFGLLQGLALIIEFLTKKIRKRLRKKIPDSVNNLFGIIFTITYFSFSLIFFKSNSLKEAFFFISHLGVNLQHIFDFQFIKISLGSIGISMVDFMIIIVAIFIMEIVQYQERKGEKIANYKPITRWTLYYSLIISIIAFGEFSKSQFIYFQF